MLVAGVARQMNAARILIDMGNPQILALGIAIGDAPGEEVAGGPEAVELEGKFGTLITH